MDNRRPPPLLVQDEAGTLEAELEDAPRARVLRMENSPSFPPPEEPSSSFPHAWDWGNFVDFSLDDSSILSWDSEDLAEDPSISAALLTDELSDSVAPSGPLERLRKRDPRLICDNYLAGKIPCSCPELEEKDEEEEEEAVGRKRVRVAATARCQVSGCEADISELKGYHRRHRVCLRCANATSVVLDGEHKRYCQQCGKFHLLEDFDEDKRSCRRKLERHNNRRRRKATDAKGAIGEEGTYSMLGDDTICEDDIVKEMLNGVSSTNNSRCLSNQTLETETILECDDHPGSAFCSVPSSQNAQSHSVSSLTLSHKTQLQDKKLNSKTTLSLSNKQTAYSSVCPTGRISFKLYDWNPAEFPRRLRHQIFQWLASMPVELEGYIRPGCTVLTVFLAMSQSMWEKLSEDGDSYLKALVHAPGSLLLRRGAMFIHLNNMIFQVLNDGASLMSIKMEVQVPRLHYVHPTCFEAGKPMVFTACGNNLFQRKFRFLVSFSGKYLVPDTCIALPQRKIETCCKTRVDCCDSCDYGAHEILKLSVPLTEPELFGPAFIEVENESGLSDFVPVLIGDKQICSEFTLIQTDFDETLGSGFQYVDATNTTESCKFLYSRQTKMLQLLLDIGWLLKERQLDGNEAGDIPTQVRRFNNLLEVLVRNESVAILERVLQKLEFMKNGGLFNSTDSTDDGDDFGMRQLQESMHKARELLCQKHKHKVVALCPGDATVGELLLKCDPERVPVHDAAECTNQNTSWREEQETVVSLGTQCGELIAPLIDKEWTASLDARPGPGELKTWGWPHIAYNNLFLRRVNATRFFILTALIIGMCCTVCVAFGHPEKMGKMTSALLRCLYWNPNS